MIKKRLSHSTIFIILLFLSLVFLAPIFIIIINSLKFKFSITEAPFTLPNSQNFAGLENFVNGFTQTDFGTAFFWSLCGNCDFYLYDGVVYCKGKKCSN